MDFVYHRVGYKWTIVQIIIITFSDQRIQTLNLQLALSNYFILNKSTKKHSKHFFFCVFGGTHKKIYEVHVYFYSLKISLVKFY